MISIKKQRYSFLRLYLIFIVLSLYAAGGYAQGKPNIILIFADDLGYTGLSSYGSRYYETPHIDKLAERGMKFTQGYACATVCAPSRASLVSGQYTPRHGVLRVTNVPKSRNMEHMYEFIQPLDKPFSTKIKTIAESLKEGGYATGMFGKWHLGPTMPGAHGFDTWIESHGKHFNFTTSPKMDIPEGKYLTDFMTDHAIEFIKENRNKPFFLYLPDFLVHLPREAKEEIIKKYEGKETAGGQRLPVYAAMTESLDHSVGRIIDFLEELDLMENTLLIFTSDNGASARTKPDGTPYLDKGLTSNLPLRDGKGLMYEGGIRVPYIFYWEGKIRPGTICEEPVIGLDLYPTLLDVAGIERPQNQVLDGVSILQCLLDPTYKIPERPLFWHYPNYGPASYKKGKVRYAYVPTDVVRLGDFKLLEFYHDSTLRLELYNLKDDIGELHNLAEEMPAKTEELYNLMNKWRENLGAQLPVPNPNFNPMKNLETAK